MTTTRVPANLAAPPIRVLEMRVHRVLWRHRVSERADCGPIAHARLDRAMVDHLLNWREGATATGAAFGDHVSDIISLGADEQMRRIHACPVVARVQHIHAGGNGSVRQKPTVAVRADLPGALGAKCAVPRRVDRSGPNPAITALVHVFPEANLGRCRYNRHGPILQRFSVGATR